jgi:predicted GTPase
MSAGAGAVAARAAGARELVDPRPFAAGTIADAFARYPHIGPVLPALGYSAAQRRDLAETIARCGADALLNASPARLERLLDLRLPVARASYRLAQRSGPSLLDLALAAARGG